MDHAELHLQIRQRIAEGKLPNRLVRTWGGSGSDQHCSGCGSIIAANELEYELESFSKASGEVVRLHHHCYAIWLEEVRVP